MRLRYTYGIPVILSVYKVYLVYRQYYRYTLYTDSITDIPVILLGILSV